MEQTAFSEADSRPPDPELVPHFNGHNLVHWSFPPVLIVSQMNLTTSHPSSNIRFFYSETCLKRILGTTKTCLYRRIFTAQRIWIPEETSKYLYEREPAWNGKARSLAIPLYACFVVLLFLFIGVPRGVSPSDLSVVFVLLEMKTKFAVINALDTVLSGRVFFGSPGQTVCNLRFTLNN